MSRGGCRSWGLVSMDQGELGLEGRIGVPEDVVGSWAPENRDIRHWEESLGGKVDGDRMLMLILCTKLEG